VKHFAAGKKAKSLKHACLEAERLFASCFKDALNKLILRKLENEYQYPPIDAESITNHYTAWAQERPEKEVVQALEAYGATLNASVDELNTKSTDFQSCMENGLSVGTRLARKDPQGSDTTAKAPPDVPSLAIAVTPWQNAATTDRYIQERFCGTENLAEDKCLHASRAVNLRR
jgi:hypothetical protein